MFISTSAHPPHTLVNKGGESGLQAPTDFKEKPKSFSRQNVERVNNWLSVDRWAPDLNLSDCLSVCMSAPPPPSLASVSYLPNGTIFRTLEEK